jgi:hypothetical protein
MHENLRLIQRDTPAVVPTENSECTGKRRVSRVAAACLLQNSIHAENTGVSRRAARQMNFPAPP